MKMGLNVEAVVLAGALAAACYGGLEQEQVVILYNSNSDDSIDIKDAYIAKYPNVKVLNLNFAYYGGDPTDFPLEDGLTEAYFTKFACSPKGFLDLLDNKIKPFLAQSGNEDVIAFVTTRDLPAVISLNFFPDQEGGNENSKSFESALMGLGYIDDVEDIWTSDNTQNPYYGFIGGAFTDAIQCRIGGEAEGKIFIASRLDSGPVGGSELTGVLDLIDRAGTIIVNKFASTLVYDGADSGNCALVSGNLQTCATMCDEGWPVYLDQTDEFLHGVYLGNQCPSPGDCGCVTIETDYNTWPELVHMTTGTHHNECSTDTACLQYISDYWPHPGGLFISMESFNGYRLQNWAQQIQGDVLDWIAAGGSFTCGNVIEPGGHRPEASYVVLNLYLHGLSWGEAILSELPSVRATNTPIGDPLSTIHVVNPDLDDDGDVDADDVEIQEGLEAVDIDGDSDVDEDDMYYVLEAFPRELPSCGTSDPLEPSSRRCQARFVDTYLGSLWACSFDVNHDGRVDDLDRDLVENGAGCQCPDLDVTGDGYVDGDDVAAMPNTDYLLGDLDDDNDVDYDDADDWVLGGIDFSCDNSTDGYDKAALWAGRADVNADDAIDCDDFTDILANFAPASVNSAYDVDLDHDVDQLDALRWRFALYFDSDVNNDGYPDSCGVCRADIAPNGGDGVVDIDDFYAVLNAFGACSPCSNCVEDIVVNCVVNTADLDLVLEAWGDCP